MAKLWGGRFKKELAEDAKALSYTVHIDKRLAPHDLQVNRAHAKALVKAGVLTAAEQAELDTALAALESRFEQDDPTLFKGDEDIHSCIERLVTETCGDIGKKLHTGKSRNDQVITDTRLFVKARTTEVIAKLNTLLKRLHQLAEKHQEVIFPGFTHLQPAQPVLFSHHMLAYFNKFERDMKRFERVFETANVCTLGSGALAGNNYGLDRELVAKELGFATLSTNSMDAVSDRDFILEFLSSASFCMTHMSRFCEELVLWSSPIFGFIEIGDDYTTGSSIMPQKKNPDVAELIRGKAGRVLGHLVSMQHTLKSLPLTYNRDLQEDKELLFDSVDTLSLCLENLANMLNSTDLNKEAIKASLEKGYLLATEFADYLVKINVPFREAHHIVGEVVRYAISEEKELYELSLAEFKQFSEQIDESVFDCLTFEAAIDAKDVFGGTARTQVSAQLQTIKGRYSWKEH